MVTEQSATIEKATQVYWLVSRAFNGRLKKSLTVGESLRATSEALQLLDPSRGISQRLNSLQNEIIHTEPKQPQSNTAA